MIVAESNLDPVAPPSVLSVKGLQTHIATDNGTVRAVDDVSFTVRRGTTLGIVGESGCGKSMTALSIMRLLPRRARIVAGEITFADEGDLLELSEARMQSLRGSRLSMIFQNPMASLNPVMRVGRQMVEAVRFHRNVTGRVARERSIEMLRLVGIPAPERRIDDYPHQLSGGMCQRVMIGMALACDPTLMLADEPTTALDVTIQAQILDVLEHVRRTLHTSIVLITHDLGVIAETADEVCVMYAGQIVESAPTTALFARPLHPYTQGLLRSVTSTSAGTVHKQALPTIPGVVPNLRALPTGCHFSDRCPYVEEDCRHRMPVLREPAPGHAVRCHRY